ncbi:hypothetical protein PS2_002146 [Malus domestica]
MIRSPQGLPTRITSVDLNPKVLPPYYLVSSSFLIVLEQLPSTFIEVDVTVLNFTLDPEDSDVADGGAPFLSSENRTPSLAEGVRCTRPQTRTLVLILRVTPCLTAVNPGHFWA